MTGMVCLCLIGLLGFVQAVGAVRQPAVEGRVLSPSGDPVAGAQVRLFDLTDLRAAALAATTDRSGHFTLPLNGPALPQRFTLGSNYPNPFNPSTIIPYQLPAPMHVRLEVFNLLGQRIATLVDGERAAGAHTAEWDATDAAGQAVGAGVYLYRLSGDGAKITRRMLLIDGQAGIAGGRGGSTGWTSEAAGTAGEAPVYGLTVSGPGRVPFVDPAFRVESGLAPLDVVLEAGHLPSGKVASGAILGDVDNTGGVDFFDALLVALYSQDSSIVMPNHGDISLGDVNADGQVDLADAWAIAAWLNDSSNASLPAGIGEAVGPAASLSPDPATVSFADDGAWHRFKVEAGEPVSVVVNPEGTTPRLEITTRSGRDNYCPAEADDDVSRRDGQSVYLAGCAEGPATVELRRQSDGTVLNTYTFTVTGSPADLVVELVSVSDDTLTPGQSFTLRATVRNQGTAAAAATTLRYYRSTNRTISTQDTETGTDQVGPLGASRTSAESIRLTAPSSEGTYYYGACVDNVTGERGDNNCSPAATVTVEEATGGGSDDHGNTRSGATSLSLGSSLAGQIEPGGDVDYFSVQVGESGTLTVYTTGRLDTKGELQDNSGTRLASNDDGGSGSNFRIERAVSAGTYYVKVEAFRSSGTGSYTIHASFSSGGGGSIPSPPNVTHRFSPSSANVGDTVSLILDWDSSSGATSYEVYIDDSPFLWEINRDGSCSAPTSSVIHSGSTSSTSYTYVFTAEFINHYWWLVRACNSNGCSCS